MTKKINFLSFIPVCLLFLILAFRVTLPDALEEFQLKTFDLFQRLQPRPYEEAPVRIIDLDDETLSRLGQWPWPRTLIAKMVSRLKELGAATVCFDIVFAEPDRTSPANVIPLWPKELPHWEDLNAQIRELPDHDTLFGRSIADAGMIITAFSLKSQKNDFKPILKTGFAHSGDDPLQYLPQFKGAVVNLPVLEKAAAGNGSFNIIAENDGIIRRVPLLFRLEDQLYPSLAAESLRIAQGASSFIVKSSGGSGETSFGEHTGINHVKIGAFVVPTDSSGRLWLYDSDYQENRFIPAWKVLEKDFDPAEVEGCILFVGTSASGLKDLRSTPLNPVAAGVEVHAQLTEQILLQKFLLRPDWASGAEVLYLFILGLCLILLLPRAGAIWCAVLGGASILTACALSWFAFIRFHWLVDPLFPSLTCLAIYFTASFFNYLRTEGEKRQVRHAFSRYMSPALVERLAKNPELLKLGGETKNMSLLFADIRGFTTISEQFTAGELTHFMNRFLTPMTDLILKQNGTIDKYMGDCIMAFWNAPIEDPLHAAHACQAALDMRAHLVRWNQELAEEAKAQGKSPLQVNIGIGINTGNCSVGNMGSDQRFDYSVIGDEVNLASRLEGQSKTYGVDTVIGPNTQEQVGSLATLELDLIKVKGKTKPAKIFALLGDKSLAGQPSFIQLKEAHQKMLSAYRDQAWEQAEEYLAECLRLDSAHTRLQSLYQLYAERIAHFREMSPGPSWDGIYVAKTK